MAKRTPLYQNHLNHGGKVVEFGGFELPVQYGAGLIAEHNAVRNAAGLFDVSHMGEFLLEGKSAFDTIQRLMSNDMTGLCDGQIRYTMMLNERGGEVDDLLVYRLSEEKYLLVVNAGNCDKDAAWVSNRLLDGTRFENLSEKTGQVALQGPKSEEILRKILPESEIPEKYYTFKVSDRVTDGKCIVSRTGYTGEDGFEIYCPAEKTPGSERHSEIRGVHASIRPRAERGLSRPRGRAGIRFENGQAGLYRQKGVGGAPRAVQAQGREAYRQGDCQRGLRGVRRVRRQKNRRSHDGHLLSHVSARACHGENRKKL